MPCKRTPPVGILHHASDWILLANLNKTYRFPVHITFTPLRPDITIFSNRLRKVILIELTCPCEENMESWHGTKINKNSALKTIIESKGWCLELFAVEVDAMGYWSRSVLCCFKKMAFNNKLIRNTIKKLRKSSMECSFCIWLTRNNKEWTPAAFFILIVFACASVCVLAYMYVFRCVVTCFPVCVHNLIVNI